MIKLLKKLWKKMIEIGNTIINTIFVGNTTPNKIDVGDVQVWPDGYYYTLTLKQTTYSSGTRLLPTGQNYATFTCYYRKYNSSSALVETTEVLAVPSANYCVANGNQLSFDYDTYKATVVVADASATVSLSYGGVSTTGTVSIAANNYNLYATITPVVISSAVIGASGASITYTGGDYTTTRRWTSGYEEAYTTGSATFSQPAYNSSVSSVIAYAISATKTVTIPSLSNNTTGSQSHYDFTSDKYGDNQATVSFTVNQAANTIHQTSDYYFWDVDNNKSYDANITIPKSPAGYFKFQIRKATSSTWDSGYDGGVSTETLNHSSYTYQNQPFMNGGCITSIGYWDSNYTLQANYSANTGNTSRMSGIICTSQNPSFTIVLTVTQPS